MSEPIKSISLSNLVAHPDNPNVMSGEKFRKLIRNIERTGLYEPIIVRPHPQKKDCFQIINGHHRVKALEKLGLPQADCVVWNVDDEQTAILLATLNRLTGADIPAKKIELLDKLRERFGSIDLAKILPQTQKQIDLLTNLKRNLPPVKLPEVLFAIPLMFFVTPEQNKIIEEAIDTASKAPGFTPGVINKSQRRAAALTEIANHFLRTQQCQT